MKNPIFKFLFAIFLTFSMSACDESIDSVSVDEGSSAKEKTSSEFLKNSFVPQGSRSAQSNETLNDLLANTPSSEWKIPSYLAEGKSYKYQNMTKKADILQQKNLLPIVNDIDKSLGYFAEGKSYPYTTLTDGYNRAWVSKTSKSLMPLYESLPAAVRQSSQPHEMEYQILKQSWRTLGLEVEEVAGKTILKRAGRKIGTFLLKNTKNGRTIIITAGLLALIEEIANSQATEPIPEIQFQPYRPIFPLQSTSKPF